MLHPDHAGSPLRDPVVDLDRPALTRPGGATVTHGELWARVDDLAERLGPVRRLVLVEMDRSVAAVVAYLAALRGRHPVLLVPPGESEVGHRLLDRYSPDVLLSGAAPDAMDPAVVERRRGSVHRLHPDLALLLTTSGTTGSPRLVRLSADNVDANARAIAAYLELGPDDVGITSLPLHYCYGLSVLNSHLLAGAQVVLTDASVSDPCFWSAVRAAGVTNLAGVPHTFRLLDQLGPDVLAEPSLRFLTQAGGRLPPERVRHYAELGERLGWRLFVMYGQTEATARMAYLPPELATSRPVAIGRAIPGGSFRVDADGELCYRGPNVMLGYADGPDDLDRGRDVEELRTGDLARIDGDGLVEIVGRRSRFLKLYGLRVDLDAVEQLLLDEGTTAACAGDDTGVVVAAVGGDPVDLASRVARRLGLPELAVHGRCVDALPLLPSGKVDYPAVLRLRPAERPAPAAGSVRELFATLLRVPPAEVTDDATFVELGGDSLTYVEASVRLEALLGTVPAGWHHLPAGELERRGVPRRRAAVDTTVALRAVGIAAVLVSHSSGLDLRGGAHLLLAVCGFNFARFQLAGIRASGRVRPLVRSARRIAVPAGLAVLALGLLTARLHPATLTFTATLQDLPAGQGHFRFWFVEVLLHLLLLLVALLAIGRVRAVERRSPLRFAAAVLGLALLIRFGLLDLPDGAHPRFQLQHVLWLFALGWCAALATQARHRVVLSAVAAVALHGFFDHAGAGVLVLAGFLVLTWVPVLPVPRLLKPAVTAVAGASLFVYLAHWHVLHLLDGAPPAVLVSGGTAAGLAAAALSSRVDRRRQARVRP